MATNAARYERAICRNRSVRPNRPTWCFNCAPCSESTSDARSLPTCLPMKPHIRHALPATPITSCGRYRTHLADMARSAVVHFRKVGNEKHYWLKSDCWAALLNRTERFPKWVTWPPLFSALERIWLKLNEPKLLRADPLLQSSELRHLMIAVRPLIEKAGFAKALSDDRQYIGENYLPAFFSDIRRLIG